MKKICISYDRIIKIIFFCFLLTIAGIFSAGAGENEEAVLIKAGVNREKATAGEPIEYRISITGRGALNVKIDLPDEKTFFPKPDKKKKSKTESKDEDPSLFVPLYQIHKARKDNLSKDNTEYLSVVMEISYYRPGTYNLPEIDFTGTDGIKIGYKIPTVTIEETNKEGNLQAIEPPLDLGGNYYRLIAIIAGTVLLTLAGVFLYRYIKKRREMKINDIPPVPPIELFRKELSETDCRKMIEENRVEEYVVRISTVFRSFLSRQFDIDAAEMTTDELSTKLPAVLKVRNLENKSGEIIRCFNLWDLSKFAEFTPSREVLLANLNATTGLAERLSSDSEESANGVL